VQHISHGPLDETDCPVGRGIAALLIVAASPASALTLTPLTDNRHVTDRFSCGQSICSSIAVPDVPFQPWSVDIPEWGVSQDSTIDVDDLSLGGSGSAFAYASSNTGLHSDSVFDVSFSIDELAEVSLSGSFAMSGIGGLGIFTLFRDVGGMEEEVFSFFPQGQYDFAYHGFLVPGIYRIGGGTSGSNAVTSSWTMQLELAPVPEPCGVALVLIALLPLAQRARR
jgi:hypothetical protein